MTIDLDGYGDRYRALVRWSLVRAVRLVRTWYLLPGSRAYQACTSLRREACA